MSLPATRGMVAISVVDGIFELLENGSKYEGGAGGHTYVDLMPEVGLQCRVLRAYRTNCLEGHIFDFTSTPLSSCR